MKRILTLVLLLCVAAALSGCGAASPSGDLDAPGDSHETALPSGGAAYAAPETYQAEWHSNTGKTVIHVDARVEIAVTAELPLVSAQITEITREQARALADLLFGEDGYGDREETSEAGYSLELTPLTQDAAGEPDGYMTLLTGYHGDIVTDSTLSYQRGDDGYHYSANEPARRVLSGETISESAYSFDEALLLACQVRDALDGDLVNVSCGAIPGEIDGTGMTDASVSAPKDAYRFDFTRSVGSVPVTYEYSSGGLLDDMNDLTIWNSDYERLTVVVSDVGVSGVQYKNPCSLLDTSEACALTAFDQLMDVASSVFPLKFAYIEQGTPGCEITVDRITMGYMRVQSRNAPGTYVMTPVLDFFGQLTRTRADGTVGGDAFEFVSQLTLSAVDGTVIDRGYGY